MMALYSIFVMFYKFHKPEAHLAACKQCDVEGQLFPPPSDMIVTTCPFKFKYAHNCILLHTILHTLLLYVNLLYSDTQILRIFILNSLVVSRVGTGIWIQSKIAKSTQLKCHQLANMYDKTIYTSTTKTLQHLIISSSTNEVKFKISAGWYC